MPRPLNRRQRRDNAAFLRLLAETGNARLAARELGANRSTFTKRRSKHPAFAAQWERALATAQEALEHAGPHPPEAQWEVRSSRAKSRGAGTEPEHTPLDYARDERGGARQGLRTTGGEPTITRAASGRLQLRQALPGRMTTAAEQAFFSKLAATANIRLAAEAAGFAHTSILARKRRFPAFAAELEETLAAAQARLDHHMRTYIPQPFPEEEDDEAPLWPPGLTVAEVLRILGAPPLKLPGTPFPARRPKSGR